MVIDFNKGWSFRKEGGPWQQIDLPHDAMLLERRDGECRNGINTGYFPGGRYRYEKTFELPESAIGQSVVLHFEGVYQNCTVSVNGVLGFSHRYGFTAFDVDISGAVRPGKTPSPFLWTIPWSPTAAGIPAPASTGLCSFGFGTRTILRRYILKPSPLPHPKSRLLFPPQKARLFPWKSGIKKHWWQLASRGSFPFRAESCGVRSSRISTPVL